MGDSIMRSLLLLALVAATACGKDDSAPRVPLGAAGASATGASTPLQAALDRGNAAYRARDYEGALRAYREAAAANPENVAPYYGIQMAARAMGNNVLADSAMRRIRAMSGDSSGADPHALPKDHPRIKVSEDVPKKRG
jgi:Flp pilus assembly protein TadD